MPYTGDNPEIAKMVAEYDFETVQAAFRIAQHIGDQGYPGINFTGKAERELHRNKGRVTWSKLNSHMKKELRSKNLGG